MTVAPDVSVVVPVYNRGPLIRYTLESIRRASQNLAVETVIVDDGSEIPTREDIEGLGFRPEKIIRQENKGLLAARLAGLERASGRYILFLDSDDLISPEKLKLQVRAMESANAEVSYTDSARCVLEGDYEALQPIPDEPAAEASDSADFFISVQPPPHSPLFAAGYLRRVVAQAFFPPSSLYNSVAEIWFYHNASIFAARVVKVSGAHAIVGAHASARLTDHWEKLGVASLAVMEAFARHCPRGEETAGARQLVAEKAFRSWRALPVGFSPEFCRRQLAIWSNLEQERRLNRLGGRGFQWLARLLGPVAAAGLLQRRQNTSYDQCRTLSDENMATLLARLPAA